MRFALINDNRVEAQPELKRLCSCCSNPVIAKCGTRKIWHWAHKSNTDCDNWWELARTIGKKYRCLMKVQEKKHIADFRTAHNLVIEFQHSHIDQQERTSREMFYKKADFIKLVGIALIIATPLDYIAANKWLQNYPYRIEMSWWLFASAGILVMLIALFTVSFQSIKTAVANPVKSLRME